jgi:hypothetical protein
MIGLEGLNVLGPKVLLSRVSLASILKDWIRLFSIGMRRIGLGSRSSKASLVRARDVFRVSLVRGAVASSCVRALLLPLLDLFTTAG